MVKLAIAFIVFAAVVMFVLMKSGGNVDMSGEKHGADAVTHSEPGASAAVPAAPASAASGS